MDRQGEGRFLAEGRNSGSAEPNPSARTERAAGAEWRDREPRPWQLTPSWVRARGIFMSARKPWKLTVVRTTKHPPQLVDLDAFARVLLTIVEQQRQEAA